MGRLQVLGIAVLAAVGLAVVPELLPTGPSNTLDPTKLLESGQWMIAAGLVFAGGLLTSLTPCVYPLIPITVGVFGARQASSRGRAFVLTSAYVNGMGLVFAILGVVAGMTGKAFGSALGNPWVVTGLALFMLVLASSMFGAFELALPSGLALKLNNVGGGGLLGALLMGSVAGFLAAPCTGPTLAGLLAWISKTQDPTLGGLLLYVYALGIGVPFFIIGVFTVRLPKGGVWMEWVKSIFGVALLALAASYLRDAFPSIRTALEGLGIATGKAFGIGIASVLAFVGVLLGAIHLSFKEKGEWPLKAVGVTAVVMAFLLRMSAGAAPEPVKVDPQLADQRALIEREIAELDRQLGLETDQEKKNVLAARLASARDGLAKLSGDQVEFEWGLVFKAEESKSADPFDAALAKARADCKPVMIDFFADWCAACKELDQHTYVAKEVAHEAHRFVTIKVDATNDHEVTDKLYEKFGVRGLPTVAFVSPTGEVLDKPRVTGFMKPKEFLSEMQKVAVATCTASP
ncbi:MAG: thioredoxin family protein [Myxococcaceae bacterium]|nr:thioredoxin family protein [Myxococcaceae bacterium]